MALNVKFLRGQSTNLLAEGKTYEDGHIYMTEDTHKLYAGIKTAGAEKASLIRLNQDIIFVESIGALSLNTHKADQFYYAKAENVLCIYDPTQEKFVQVNPDDGAIAVGFEGAEDGNILVGARYDSGTRQMVFTKGKLTAKNVETTTDIKVTKATGNYAVGATLAKGSNIEDILLNMLCQDVQPSKSNPSASIEFYNGTTKLTENKTYEVGYSFTPKAKLTISRGSYSANGVPQASGVKINSITLTESNRPGVETQVSKSQTTDSTSFEASFDVLQVTDDMISKKYQIKGSASHSEGVLAKTYLNKDSDPEVKIAAGTKTADSFTIGGYRAVFYGYKTSTTMLDVENLTSAQIRSLTKGSSRPSTLSTNGMQQMIFAFPASMKVDSVTCVGEPAPRTIKKLNKQINVDGDNNYTAVPYDIFYCTEGSANDGSEKFTLTYTTK